MAMLTVKVKIENFKEEITKILNFVLQMTYVPQKKAEIIYNLCSGRKNNVFQEKSFCFENFNFCIQGVTKKMAPLTNF